MKTVGIPALVLSIILILGLMLMAFQVRETELVFVTRLGKAVRTMDKPGLYFIKIIGVKWLVIRLLDTQKVGMPLKMGPLDARDQGDSW